MNWKETFKIIGASVLCGCIFLFSLLYGIFILQSEYGIALSFILGLILLCLIVFFCYPVWFKDYIDEYWRRKEADEQKEKQGN